MTSCDLPRSSVAAVRIAAAAGLLASFMVVPAGGQTPARPTPSPSATPPAAPPPPVSSEPATTTASFGDWTLRCNRLTDATGKALRICEVGQALQVQGQSAPIAQLAIGRTSPADPLRLTIVLPNNVSFPSTVRVALADNDPAPLELAWRRCVQGGCFADAPTKEDVTRRWRAATDPGRVAFKDAAGRDVTLPLSFRGLAPALDALAKEPL